jgi:hydroxypyruvate reductase
MAGASGEASALGYEIARLDPPTIGEASAAAVQFLDAARTMARRSSRPLCVVAAGETTVALPLSGDIGIGGRNQEFALAAAAGLADLGVCALASVGTDGIDGPTSAAGAIADSTTIARAAARGLTPASFLARHDAHAFFGALDDLVVTGATGTNVGDLQVLLIAP